MHCVSKRQAEDVLAAITKRMTEVALRLHSEKRRVVYCKDSNRKGEHEHTSFSFLGYASGHGRRSTARPERTSPRSCPRSAPRRSRPKAPTSARSGSTGAPT